ncbi:MAG TPA: hypothetical protein ENN99_01260 [Chloroflexi bacterium]|nr:hypothetical protein [Chloroflexota bacterium]
MKFLVDECTGISVVDCLRDEGYDVMAVAEVMPQADDEQILERAVSQDRILVTNERFWRDDLPWWTGTPRCAIVTPAYLLSLCSYQPVIPAKAGIHTCQERWIPAKAGMTIHQRGRLSSYTPAR